MPRYIPTTDVAKMIRTALKATFPTCRFSVRSSMYSGGSSIRVYWTDGPTTKRVEEVVGRYEGASFDGMVDLKSYHTSQLNGEAVRFGNDFLFFDRTLSSLFVARVAKEASRRLGWAIPSTMEEASRTRIEGLNEYASTIIRNFAEDRTGGPRYN